MLFAEEGSITFALDFLPLVAATFCCFFSSTSDSLLLESSESLSDSDELLTSFFLTTFLISSMALADLPVALVDFFSGLVTRPALTPSVASFLETLVVGLDLDIVIV